MKSIKHMQTEAEYKKQYIIRKAVRLQQARARNRKIREYMKAKHSKWGGTSDYKKGQLDPAVSVDHGYSRW